MQLEVGKIYEGKVTGITKFGAFVELDKNTTGMVHISEVAQTFVEDIKDHLKEGQVVKVKVLALSEDNKKISLSIKKALPAPAKKQGDRRQNGGSGGNGRGRQQGGNQRSGQSRGDGQGQRRRGYEKEPQDLAKNPPPVYFADSSGDPDFEEMMSKFKASSEEKFSDLKHLMDNKRRSSSRRK